MPGPTHIKLLKECGSIIWLMTWQALSARPYPQKHVAEILIITKLAPRGLFTLGVVRREPGAYTRPLLSST